MKTKFTQPKINYVAGPPGIGKTKAAVEFMRRHAINGKGYVFYVAPTRELIKQTIFNLKSVLDLKTFQKKVRAAYSTESGHTFNRIDQQVYNILNDRSNDGLEQRILYSGSIIFLTHQTFIELRNHSRFKDITVIFDEARQWATMMEYTKLDGSAEDFFDSLFTLEPIEVSSGFFATGIKLIKAKKKLNATAVDLISGPKSARVFKQLETMYMQLVEKEGSPTRMEVYAIIQNGAKKRVMVQVKLPSQPFVGFKNVYILSASFTSSQMFHFLLAEAVAPIDKTQEFLNEYLEEGYDQALANVINRYKKVKIIPLLADPGMPAINQLRNGVLISNEKLKTINEGIKKLNLDSRDIRYCNSLVRNPGLDVPDENLMKGVEFIEANLGQTNAIRWLIDQSIDIANRCHRKYGKLRRALLFINDCFQDVEYDKKVFEYLSHAKAEGRNDFMSANVVAFLASINPRPELARVLKLKLRDTGYDPDEDFVVDRAVQCLSRGNVRDPNSENFLYVIVTTVGLAYRIKDRMSDVPEVKSSFVEKLGNYQFWCYTRPKSSGERKSRARKPKTLTLQEQKELNKLRVYYGRYKKSGDSRKLKRVEIRIKELIEKRDSINRN